MLADRFVPTQVRAAIAAFLNECQNEARPLAAEQALGAIGAIFPNLNIPDEHLKDAILSEAAAADFDVKEQDEPSVGNRNALERWDDEGGAIASVPSAAAPVSGRQRPKAYS